MHSRTEELLNYLNTQHERTRLAVDRVPVAQRERRPGTDRWSVSEVLEHLSIVERRIHRLLQMKIAEARATGLGAERDESPVVGTMDMDRVLDRTRKITAGEAALPTGNLSAEDAWHALDNARASLCDTVRECDGLAIGEIMHPHPVLGPINLYQWIAFVGAHEARHAAQIVEIADSSRQQPI
jgi:hypothetical protein